MNSFFYNWPFAWISPTSFHRALLGSGLGCTLHSIPHAFKMSTTIKIWNIKMGELREVAKYFLADFFPLRWFPPPLLAENHIGKKTLAESQWQYQVELVVCLQWCNCKSLYTYNISQYALYGKPKRSINPWWQCCGWTAGQGGLEFSWSPETRSPRTRALVAWRAFS